MYSTGRRDLLRTIVGAAVLAPALSACELLDFTPDPPPPPDALTALYTGTVALAALYEAQAAGSTSLVAIRDAHRAHASALAAIMYPSPSPAPSASPTPGTADFKELEQAAWRDANDACLSALAARAVLLGEIAAARATHLTVLEVKAQEVEVEATPSSGPSASVAAVADPERLRAALAAEHAALFAYGRLGVLLDDAGKAEARTAEIAHRARRDSLIVQLDELQASPAPAQPGYALPFPVTDKASALRLAVHVEEGVAGTWRTVLKAVDGERRRVALAAYSGSAVQATRWRQLAGIVPVTTPFPGRVA